MSYGYSNGNDMVMPVTPMGYGNGGNGNGGFGWGGDDRKAGKISV